MLAIINYGIGNLLSVKNMFAKIGCKDVIIASKKEELEQADKFILPGVGHFDAGMKKLKSSGLSEILKIKVQEEKAPVLGICLGAQMLCEGSEEGDQEGLGWINGYCKKFDLTKMEKPLAVPHMGWSEVKTQKNSFLIHDLPRESRFYFVHSYYIVCENLDDCLLTAEYGCKFAAAVQKDNIYGTQFHPEKSHKFGMKLLSNFAHFHNEKN